MPVDENIVRRVENPGITITPGDFSLIPQKGDFKTSAYLSRSANAEVLRTAAEQFGITPWYLFKLLGANTDHGYKWLSGNRRPSAAYLIRLLRLYQIYGAGLDILRILKINWDTGQIILKGQETNDQNQRDIVIGRR